MLTHIMPMSSMQLFTGSADGSVRIWDTVSGQVRQCSEHMRTASQQGQHSIHACILPAPTCCCLSCVPAQCKHTLTVGGEVDSMLISGGFLFVGLHKAGEGIIKVWNMSTNADHLLTGHKVCWIV
jgi:WD40 repeat protein